jgi:hypothetical protein
MAEQQQQWLELAEAQKKIADLRACAEIDKQVRQIVEDHSRIWERCAWDWMRFALENLPDHPEVADLKQHFDRLGRKMDARRQDENRPETGTAGRR